MHSSWRPLERSRPFNRPTTRSTTFSRTAELVPLQRASGNRGNNTAREVEVLRLRARVANEQFDSLARLVVDAGNAVTTDVLMRDLRHAQRHAPTEHSGSRDRTPKEARPAAAEQHHDPPGIG
jgi:hypothetical protein